MGIPSSQIISAWVKAELSGTDWISLQELCLFAVRRRWAGKSETQISELVEGNIAYVANHLREEANEWVTDGAIATFQIDDEPIPYVRLLDDGSGEVLAKLRKIDPFALEEVCAQVISRLGAESRVTQRTNDGGVDFVGFNLKIVPNALTVPTSCHAAVIGQAKRYKEGNTISETRLREFVGAATLRRHELQRDGKIGPLTPVLCAFWTTSDFDPNAKRYGRTIGIWYMDGRTLASYVVGLGLRKSVMTLADNPSWSVNVAVESSL